MTQDARIRLAQAASTVSDSSRAMDGKRPAEAAQKARDAARRLDSLARQVGALKASELSERLARERDFAQEIARAERELAKAIEQQAQSPQPSAASQNSLAARQRELAEDTAALADVLEQIKSAARLDEPELARAIEQAESSNPPKEVEQAMRQNAQAIAAGESEATARDAGSAAERLEASRTTSSRPGGLQPAPSSSACSPPRKRPPPCKSASHREPGIATGPPRASPRRPRGPARSARTGRRGNEAGSRYHVECRSRRPFRLGSRRQSRGRRRELFRSTHRLYPDAGRGCRRLAGANPGNGPRKQPGRTQRASPGAVQEPGWRLLSSAFSGPEVKRKRPETSRRRPAALLDP